MIKNNKYKYISKSTIFKFYLTFSTLRGQGGDSNHEIILNKELFIKTFISILLPLYIIWVFQIQTCAAETYVKIQLQINRSTPMYM